MFHNEIFQRVIGAMAILTATGCGDPSLSEVTGAEDGDVGASSSIEGPDVAEGSSIEGPDVGARSRPEEELSLACESVCDAVQECDHVPVPADCTEQCVATYAVTEEQGEECFSSRIDLINCISALSCDLVSAYHHECMTELTAGHDDCGDSGLTRRLVDDGERERVLESDEPRSIAEDTGADPEETEPDESAGSEVTEVTEVTEPVVVVEIPGVVVGVDPWVLDALDEGEREDD